MARLSDLAVEVVRQAPGSRAAADIAKVAPWLAKTSEVLRSISKSAMQDILQFCEFRSVERNKVIIRQSDRGHEFFVMLSGRSAVYIDASKSGENAPDTAEEAKVPLTFKEKRKKKKKKEEEEERNEFGKRVLQYGPGKSFGEFALISEKNVRNASVITEEDSELLVISRELFNKSLKEQQQQEYEERAQFIAESPLFRSWDPRFRRLLEMSVRKETFPRNAPIVRQGAPLRGLLFISRGRARILLSPSDHDKQFPFVACQASEEEAVTPRGTRQAGVHLRRSGGYAAAEKKQRSRQTEIALVGPGEVIGDVEFIMALDCYCTSVVANSEVDCFVLDLKSIERLVQRKHAVTTELLTAGVAQKLEARCRLRPRLVLFHILRQAMTSRKPPRPPSTSAATIIDAGSEKDEDPAFREIRQQMRLFLMNRASMAPSCVKDSVEVRMHSARTAKYWDRRLQERAEQKGVALTQEERLRRHRQRRTPQSIRQLQHMTIGAGGAMVSEFTRERRPLTADQRRQSTTASSRLQRRKSSAISRDTEEVDEEDDRETLDSEGEAWEEGAGGPTEREARRRLRHLLETNATDPEGDVESNANILALVKIVQQLQELRAQKEKRATSCLPRPPTGRTHFRPISAPPKVIHGEEDGPSPFVTDWASRRKSVAIRRPTRPISATPIEAFDWETSDKVLEELEDRMKEFLGRLAEQNGAQTNGAKVDLKPLHRFEVDPDHIPRPGGTVLIWPRPCSEQQTAEHAHVRHFILPRNALAVMQSLRATNMRRDKDVLRSARPFSAAVPEATAQRPSVPDVSLSEMNRSLRKTRERTKAHLKEGARGPRNEA